MNNYTKRVCLLYRTDTTLPQDKPAMNRQKDICITFAEQHGWHPIREFWESTDDEMGPEKTEDALLELRACAEQKKFDILLVPRFVCIGRVPEESFYAAAFFERMGIEVWDTIEGRIVSVF